MLRIVHSLKDLNFSQLMDVYIEGNLEKREVGLSLLEAEQDFYQYLQEVFFPTRGACYCLWEERGCCVSAMRLEPYRDGWLLEALETRPDRRRCGYGKMLVEQVISMEKFKPIYSHIHRRNTASLRLHEKCGFEKILDYAVYIDGSVNDRCVTYCQKGRVAR